MNRTLKVALATALACVLAFSLAPPAHAATYDTSGDAWSYTLTGCRTRAQAVVSGTGSTRTVNWYTSASCNRTMPFLTTHMVVSSGFPLNVVVGPVTKSCNDCSFIDQSGSYTTSLNQLHYVTATMKSVEQQWFFVTPVGWWTPAPLFPCTPTAFNNIAGAGWLDCLTNTVFNTSG